MKVLRATVFAAACALTTGVTRAPLLDVERSDTNVIVAFTPPPSQPVAVSSAQPRVVQDSEPTTTSIAEDRASTSVADEATTTLATTSTTTTALDEPTGTEVTATPSTLASVQIDCVASAGEGPSTVTSTAADAGGPC